MMPLNHAHRFATGTIEFFIFYWGFRNLGDPWTGILPRFHVAERCRGLPDDWSSPDSPRRRLAAETPVATHRTSPINRWGLLIAALLRSFFALPLASLKIVAAIRWEALRLWLRAHDLCPVRMP